MIDFLSLRKMEGGEEGKLKQGSHQDPHLST